MPDFRWRNSNVRPARARPEACRGSRKVRPDRPQAVVSLGRPRHLYATDACPARYRRPPLRPLRRPNVTGRKGAAWGLFESAPRADIRRAQGKVECHSAVTRRSTPQTYPGASAQFLRPVPEGSPKMPRYTPNGTCSTGNVERSSETRFRRIRMMDSREIEAMSE